MRRPLGSSEHNAAFSGAAGYSTVVRRSLFKAIIPQGCPRARIPGDGRRGGKRLPPWTGLS